MVLIIDDGGVAAASRWRPACAAPGAPTVPLSSRLAWTANSKRSAQVMVQGQGRTTSQSDERSSLSARQ